jgi:RNA polymerase sigma-70 factor (ECF subfamily)
MNDHELEQLLITHHRDAYLWARQCCSYEEDDAKEILQLVYLKIYERKAIYRAKSSFKTWLFSVIRFTAIDFVRKKPTYEPLDNHQIIAYSTDDNEHINYIRLLKLLPDRQQEVLLLSFYHDMSLSEIASVLEVHIGTVKTHYQRGKQALRKILEKDHDG